MNSRIPVLLITAFALMTCIALLGAGKSAPEEDMPLNHEFDLKIGRTAVVKAAGLSVTFQEVTEDSRCPQGVDCIWAGNATVRIKLSGSHTASTSVDLKTELEPKSKQVDGYRITLVKLRPYPKNEHTIRKEDYVATFIVQKVHSINTKSPATQAHVVPSPRCSISVAFLTS